MKLLNKSMLLSIALSTLTSCNSPKTELIGEYEFKTLHYLRTVDSYRSYKKKQIRDGGDFSKLGSGKLRIIEDPKKNSYIIDLTHTSHSNDRYARKPRFHSVRVNFESKDIIELENSLNFNALLPFSNEKLNCKVFLENGKKVLALEKYFIETKQIKSNLNPWFYKIDDEYIYFYIDLPKNTTRDFYTKQVELMKDSLQLKNLKSHKITRLKNGIKYITKNELQ